MEKPKNRILLGCVADDFTGASDAASFLRNAGLRTLLMNEIQKDFPVPEQTDAVVIALKSRTEVTDVAVHSTLEAIKWLENQGTEKFYFKYCSTFDSTKKGNIGPVADAIMEYLGETCTILCPALPVNGRIVRSGKLYVNGVPLDQSPMKNHPLTPMWDSRIKALIETQSKYHAYEWDTTDLNTSAELLRKKCLEIPEDHFYIVPDYTCEQDGQKIADLFGHLRFLTGGSGILTHLGIRILQDAGIRTRTIPENSEAADSKGVVIAGSCSIATLAQIQDFQEKGHPSFRIDPFALYNGTQTKQEIIDFVLSHPDNEVLIYSSDTSEKIKEVQKLGTEIVAAMIERTLGSVANALLHKGYGRIVVAGGETSGAVTKVLGYDVFEIGDSVAPGVPIMIPVQNKHIRLVLKSGNFGQVDFFTRALEMTR
ncbi:MAG: 3-oxo-tetronate kinase [Sellimonas intestinalis]|uniref:3-oxo-tetronate kinase n=1 Tax=Sellimonas intestinalis TaxID=1653434 RepID=UPI003991BF49